MSNGLTDREQAALDYLKVNISDLMRERRENRDKPATPAQVGDIVVIGEWNLTKSLWRIEHVDHMGNLKMVNTRGTAHRNYPNVNVLAGGLQRVNGLRIQGRPLPNSKGGGARA